MVERFLNNCFSHLILRLAVSDLKALSSSTMRPDYRTNVGEPSTQAAPMGSPPAVQVLPTAARSTTTEVATAAEAAKASSSTTKATTAPATARSAPAASAHRSEQ